jgi:uncharacterized membrane protein
VSTIEIIALAIVVVVALFFLVGLLGGRAYARRHEAEFADHVRAADEALEQARALDKGWHRETMEAAARAALAEQRPDFAYDALQLVLVDDHPGIEQDRAHFMAAGVKGEARVILNRDGDRWVAARIE